MLDDHHYKFAKQSGVTHLLVHIVDYFGNADKNKTMDNQPVGSKNGWGKAGKGELWLLEELLEIKVAIN